MTEVASLDESRLREVFRALHAQAVDYAVFGAGALGLHGLARATGDVDLFIRPEADNIARLVVTPRTLWRMKKDTVRPLDRLDAAMLADRFGLRGT